MPINRKLTVSHLNIRSVLRAGLLLVSLIALCLLIAASADRNLAFKESLKAVLRQPADYHQALTSLEPILPQDCRVYWQAGIIALRMADPLILEASQDKLLSCGPDSVDWLFLIAPQNADLAQHAVQLYPQETSAWLWLGDLVKASGNLPLASQYYAESARLNPSDGLAWCRLGWVEEAQERLPSALDAFRKCCQNGDPGSNGCYGAGRVAEKLGDIPAAIRYYSLSHWQPALQRADELEESQ